MPEPTTTGAAGILISASGITIFGLSIGLRPELMLAGLWGAFWALSYAEPMPMVRRASLSILASILSGYGTPAAMSLLENTLLRSASEALLERLQFPVAVGFGFLSHRILGPFLLRLAKKKTDEVAP